MHCGGIEANSAKNVMPFLRRSFSCFAVRALQDYHKCVSTRGVAVQVRAARFRAGAQLKEEDTSVAADASPTSSRKNWRSRRRHAVFGMLATEE